MGDNQQPQPCPGHAVPCRYCDESGKDPHSFGMRKCDVCKGVGSVLLK